MRLGLEKYWKTLSRSRPIPSNVATDSTNGPIFLAQDDVRKAFDNVPITKAMEFLRRHIDDERLLGVVEVVLRGDDNHEIGID
jgi:hypothetical protein